MVSNADLAFEQVRAQDYEAILLLGGRAPEYLRNNESLLDILRAFDRAEKWIFAICHGVQVLAAAGLAGGKQVTCYHHVRREAELGGAKFIDQHAVRRRTRRHRPNLAVASLLLSRNLHTVARRCLMPLDPEVAAYLEAQILLPPRSALDIAATRERLRQAAALAGTPPALARVENLVLAGYLRARQYWPATDSAAAPAGLLPRRALHQRRSGEPRSHLPHAGPGRQLPRPRRGLPPRPRTPLSGRCRRRSPGRSVGGGAGNLP